MRANLLSLQSTQSLLGSTQLRLATGNKVNSALDNPSSFFAAQSLNNRAGDLSALLDGMGQAVQTLKAADEGIKGLTKLVQSAKAVAEDAKTVASSSTSGGADTSVWMDTADIADLTATLLTANDAIKVRAGTGPEYTVTFDGTNIKSLQDFADAINGMQDLKAEILIGDGTTGGLGQQAIKISTTNGTALDFTNAVNTPMADLGLADAAAGAATQAQIDLETQYNDLLTQIDQFVADTGYRGINLLNGDTLTAIFNEDGTSSQDTVGTARDSVGLAITAADFSTTAAIDASIDEIKAALDTLRTDASKYGNSLSVIQTRQDFTTNLANVLRDGAAALTVADKNEEGANMLALQTTQQLGITSLSLASQANQSVLRLFQ